MEKIFIVVSGPTAVGKTDFVNNLIAKLPFKAEIINGDMGQMYKQLSIGTAKPDISKQLVKHHLFDVIDTPQAYSVRQYRDKLIECMNLLWSKNIVPIIVGGSGFYLKSIFFPPQEIFINNLDANLKYESEKNSNKTNLELWNELAGVDPDRAKAINYNDRYRVERALHIYYKTGQKPSCYVPRLDLPGKCLFYFLSRDKKDLHERIEDRTGQMLDLGWIEEVKSLDNYWHKFLKEKKIIGYPEIINFLKIPEDKTDANIINSNIIDSDIKKELKSIIAQKTKDYAKRQMTFWRSLKKDLDKYNIESYELNLTLLGLDLYLDQLSKQLACLFG